MRIATTLLFSLLMAVQLRAEGLPISYSSHLEGLALSGADHTDVDLADVDVAIMRVNIANTTGREMKALSFTISFKMADGTTDQMTHVYRCALVGCTINPEAEIFFQPSKEQVVKDINVMLDFASFTTGKSLGNAHTEGAHMIRFGEVAEKNYRKWLTKVAKTDGLTGVMKEIDRP